MAIGRFHPVRRVSFAVCSGESFKLTGPAFFVNPSGVVIFSTFRRACRRLTLSI